MNSSTQASTSNQSTATEPLAPVNLAHLSQRLRRVKRGGRARLRKDQRRLLNTGSRLSIDLGRVARSIQADRVDFVERAIGPNVVVSNHAVREHEFGALRARICALRDHIASETAGIVAQLNTLCEAVEDTDSLDMKGQLERLWENASPIVQNASELRDCLVCLDNYEDITNKTVVEVNNTFTGTYGAARVLKPQCACWAGCDDFICQPCMTRMIMSGEQKCPRCRATVDFASARCVVLTKLPPLPPAPVFDAKRDSASVEYEPVPLAGRKRKRNDDDEDDENDDCRMDMEDVWAIIAQSGL